MNSSSEWYPRFKEFIALRTQLSLIAYIFWKHIWFVQQNRTERKKQREAIVRFKASVTRFSANDRLLSWLDEKPDWFVGLFAARFYANSASTNNVTQNVIPRKHNRRRAEAPKDSKIISQPNYCIQLMNLQFIRCIIDLAKYTSCTQILSFLVFLLMQGCINLLINFLFLFYINAITT